MTVGAANWINLQGAVNARDVGGLPTVTGGAIRPRTLIRSASLKHLTEADVRHLVGDLGVRRVVDLRTDLEVEQDGPGPLHVQPEVVIHHLSLYPDTADQTETPASSVPSDLPWQKARFLSAHRPVVAAYLQFLEQRPDSVLAALRAIAEPSGATVVHCAAGKDRTGIVVALALSLAGVPREVIAADYAQTQSQIAAILTHLARSDQLYGHEVQQPETIPPASAAVMTAVLDAIDTDFDGVPGWLASHGWTEADTARLLDKLLDRAS